MSLQRALLVKELGKPVELVHDHPVPLPGPGQVQVQVSVAGLNPHDQRVRDLGQYISPPTVLGNDVVGKVTKLGAGVTEFAVGDRIAYQAQFTREQSQTGLQEYAVADNIASTGIPSSISDDQAATLPSNIFAPLVAIFDTFEIPPPWAPESKSFDYNGATILIIGGGTNCGKFAVQLAKLAGIGRIVAVGGPVDELLSYGATHVLDRHGGYDSVLSRVKEAVGDDLLYACDTINPAQDQTLGLDALSNSKKGILATLLPRGSTDDARISKKEAGFVWHKVIGSSHAKPALAVDFWKRLPGYLEQGQITPLQFTAKQGLEAIHVNEVLDAYRDGKSVTRLHVHI
ncbi:unnamed protein product [Clonostachys rosea]|uniref:Enoyl reductase (ER) domain-containing protein n=1 Tax=Bionectria ochroleuca TaxID=29856 RepID=A0ABY6U2T1_BIOOC|nr:unnamed protein product [Clonostachys rosea]